MLSLVQYGVHLILNHLTDRTLFVVFIPVMFYFLYCLIFPFIILVVNSFATLFERESFAREKSISRGESFH